MRQNTATCYGLLKLEVRNLGVPARLPAAATLFHPLLHHAAAVMHADVHEIIVCKTTPRTPVARDEAATGQLAADPSAASNAHPAAVANLSFNKLDGAAVRTDAFEECEPQQSASAGGATDTSSEDASSAGATRLHVCLPGALPAELQGMPSIYFGRTVPDPRTEDGGSARHPTGATVTMLLPSGPSLSSLHLLLEHVVAPLAAAAAQHGSHDELEQSLGGDSKAAVAMCEAEPGQPPPNGSRWQKASHRSSAAYSAAAAELLAATHKFTALVAAAERHVRSEVGVELPAVDLQDVAAAARSEEAVLACERCMEGWVRLAADTLQREAGLRPVGRGPLVELEFWQARAEAYGGLLEQLSVPAVRATQGVVEAGSLDRNLAASFRAQLAELARLAMEARDNTRFLLTMERHLRTLADGSLAAVVEALQPMLNALRMVGRGVHLHAKPDLAVPQQRSRSKEAMPRPSLQIWVVSRYYGDDVAMSNLLERIAQGLQVWPAACARRRALPSCAASVHGHGWRLAAWVRAGPAGWRTGPLLALPSARRRGAGPGARVQGRGGRLAHPLHGHQGEDRGGGPPCALGVQQAAAV